MNELIVVVPEPEPCCAHSFVFLNSFSLTRLEIKSEANPNLKKHDNLAGDANLVI